VVEDFEKEYLIKQLEQEKGNIRRAAKQAGMHEKNFHEKLKKYNITYQK
jgi:DNA-binding NtrC family response regulator